MRFVFVILFKKSRNGRFAVKLARHVERENVPVYETGIDDRLAGFGVVVFVKSAVLAQIITQKLQCSVCNYARFVFL